MERKASGLFLANITVVTKADSKEEAERQIMKGVLVPDDVIEVEPFDLNHINGEVHRERMRRALLMELKRLER